ncbi:MAG: N-Acetyl-D-glucosamine ABC transport system, permease protein 1 [uncultured Thermomicrobiales bacterium]|uniref:N-Acetyl-D-glucosamine ABC transport system, permease protein 1 n=1 Tax=uncultured Thermomicrobiales bacterium TaxID=1645740 RepID=A0A6J4USF7_9BACT|nr:MAG: N-Acetyl-D-glucosamine ABC transport system, permease protein 1 [uncultured Thermomicrobiales bacterium]
MEINAAPVAEVAAARLPRTSTARFWHREGLLLIPFLTPALLFYAVFLLLPLAGTIALSFTEWSGFNVADIEWVGLANFEELGNDPIFWQSLRHNLTFLFGSVVLKTAVALLLALALDQNLPFSNFFRGVYLMPTVISLVVVGIVFTLVLSPSLGLVNPLLEAIGLGDYTRAWLGDPDTVLPLIIVIDAWHGFGLYMFLFISRLIAIPQDLHDAAFVDGASGVQDILHITLPLMKSMVAMVVLLAAIESLKMFALVFILTRGGPNHASEVLSSWAYFQGFTANKVGYGSAILVVLLIITFILAYIQVTRFQPKDEY